MTGMIWMNYKDLASQHHKKLHADKGVWNAHLTIARCKPCVSRLLGSALEAGSRVRRGSHG